MHLALSILPVALLVALMTLPVARLRMPWPAHAALPAVALLAYGMQLFLTASRATSDDAPAHRPVHAAAIDGVLSALTPLAIVLGAVLLFKTMDRSGALGVLAARLRRLSPDPVAQLMLVGWAFSFLIEGLSGFGTSAALAAPILVGLGFPALRVAAMCLIMNSVPVSFGAVGTPTWFGLGGVHLAAGELGEIGWRTALVHAAAAPLVAVLALRVVRPWAEIRRRLAFVLLVVAASVGPYTLSARFNVEFPSIVGGLTGLVGAAALVRWRIGLPSATAPDGRPDAPAPWLPADSHPGTDSPEPQPPPDSAAMPPARAVTPLLFTILLLAVTRIDALGLKALLNSESGAATATIPGLGEAWISPALVVGLRGILGTDADWRMPLLYVPFILPFVVVAAAAIPVLNMSRADVRSVWAQTFRRLARPAVALVGALVLAKVLTTGGDASPVSQIGLALADATGKAWPFFAPLLGALGSFFSGSNTVSNLMFGPIQAAIADSLGLDRATVLALQSAGGAMGNMVCIHNIVAVAAVLGLSERPAGTHATTGGIGGVAAVLRLTIGPMLVYAIIAAAMAGVFAILYP